MHTIFTITVASKQLFTPLWLKISQRTLHRLNNAKMTRMDHANILKAHTGWTVFSL